MKKKTAQVGFTLIELLVILGVFGLLTALATVNLGRPQQKATIESSLLNLEADIHSQQLKAMTNDSDTLSTAQTYGIYFTSSGYTLFRGSSYSAANASNFTVNLERGVTFTTINLPSSQIVFSQRSGEIASFSATTNSVTMTNATSNEVKTVLFNKYGVITIN